MDKKVKQLLAIVLALTLALTGIQWPEKGAQAAIAPTGRGQNTSSIDADISVSADDSFGKLMKKTLESEQSEQEANKGYNVFSIEIENNVARVQMETMKDCTLVVGIYEEDETTMLTSESKAVSEEDKSVTLQFSAVLPSYFYIKAFLVDDALHPLCTVYENPNYTKEMQEFFAKTTKDFDEGKVLNLDSDNTNNFAVYGKETKVISHTANTNRLADSKDGTYVFDSIDDSILSLKRNDIFAYEQDNGEVLLVKVGSISIAETTATITEDDTSIEEVFDYVKIDTQQDLGNASVDDSTCGEDIVYNGLTQGIADRKTSGNKSLEASETMKQNYTLGNASLGNDTAKISGSMQFSLNCYTKLFVSTSKQYAEIRFDYVLDNKITAKVKSENEITLAKVSFRPVPIITVTLTPVFYANLNLEGTVQAKVSGQVGYIAEGKKIKNLTNSPKVDLDCDIDGSLYIGVSLRPVVSFIDEKIAMMGMTAKVGAEAVIKLSKPTENMQHTCKVCFEGDITFQYSLLFEAKFLNLDSLHPKYTMGGERKITDYYFSVDHREFGTGVCPYKAFKVSVTVYDSGKNPVQDAYVNNDAVTNEKGNAVLFLKGGQYTITVSKDGIGKAERKITIKKPAKISLSLSQVSDGTEDLDSTDDGTNIYFGRYYQKKIVDKAQIKELDEVKFSEEDTATIGDVKYYKNRSGYYKEAPIAWKVIDDDGAYYTLLSKKILAWWTYSAPDNFWPKSNIRERLNDEFYNTAFSKSEQADIADTTISTTEISYEDVYIDHENNVILDTVTDKVYLLSLDDVINPKYGFSGDKEEESASRIAYTTQFVDDEENPARYWLLGKNYWFYGMLHGEYVTSHGNVADSNLVYGSVSNAMGVRPVIRVKKTSSNLFTRADILQNAKKAKQKGAVNRKKASQKTVTGLQPDTVYNFYAVVSKEAENACGSDNLLYITQASSDANGTLRVTYEAGQSLSNAEEFVMPLQKNIEGADVDFNTWIRYDGAEHLIEPVVTNQGILLKEGTDYEITGDYSATQEGSYSITVNGIGDYIGFVTISYTISSSDKPKETQKPEETQKPDMPETTPVPEKSPEPNQPEKTQTPESSVSPTSDPMETMMPEETITPAAPTNTPAQAQDAVTNDVKIKAPGKVTGVTVRPKKGKMKVRWTKKKSVSGYQIRYARNKALTKKKKTIRVGKSVNRKTIIKLAKGKTYYVCVRAFKKTSSGKKYGKWSKIKRVTIRK